MKFSIKTLIAVSLVVLVIVGLSVYDEKEEAIETETETTNILAGTTSPFIEFNKADYQEAVSDGKTILLYFYATWCPSCIAELKRATMPAFDEINNENVIAFRVNFSDGSTDADEVSLARDFGVTSQHTKVVLGSDGTVLLKSPETWDKDRYLSEIESLALTQ